MNSLTSSDRRRLRARAHHLRPVVMIGDAGLTVTVLREIDVTLKSHELIKIRVSGSSRRQRANMASEICGALNAIPVQQIGKILVIFRPAPEPARETVPPRAAIRNSRRHTKGSHQYP